MKIVDIAEFEVATEGMEWPWIAFDATGSRFAYPRSASVVATHSYDGARVSAGPAFDLPDGLTTAHVQGLTIHRDGERLAIVVHVNEASTLILCDAERPPRSIALGALLGEAMIARALVYDRNGAHLWVSAESDAESCVFLLDAHTAAVIGSSKGRIFPPPAMHELYIHPVDDAVLLLASCGQDGTFARVVGFDRENVNAIPTPLDDGAVPAGFVGFSADATRVHLAEADELRTHAWPGLEELSSTELEDDFISNYSGAVFADDILIDGQIEGGADDAVMQFDKSALYGRVVAPPVPFGMWAGRIGRDAIVTVDPKTKPARGRVVRVIVAPVMN